MHDSSEALCSDVNTILKRLIPQYKAIELRVEQVIARKYHLPFPNDPVVKDVDMRMLKTEMAQLLPGDDADDLPGMPFRLKLACWTPAKARREFLKRFNWLTSSGPRRNALDITPHSH